MSYLLSVQNLFYEVKNSGLFGSNQSYKSILKDINFSLGRGKIMGIAGESGSGKTTLAKIIAGIIHPSGGKINFNIDESWKNKRTKPVQILFQNNGEILNPYRQIETMMLEALRIRNDSRKNISEEMELIFNSLNFPKNLWNRKGYQLSGGEQQRAALARLLATKPELLILDEPFSAQDSESQLNLLNLFKKINSTFNITMICIAHNLQILNKLCDQLLIIYKGVIVESGSTSEIFSSPQHSYTKFLLKAGKYNLSSEEIKFELDNLPEN